MNIEQEKMIVEALPSLYPLQEFEEKAVHKVIDALHSAEPKTGKWVDDGDPLMLTCGNCGYAVMRYNNTPFCPNCGANMEDGEDETD